MIEIFKGKTEISSLKFFKDNSYFIELLTEPFFSSEESKATIFFGIIVSSWQRKI